MNKKVLLMILDGWGEGRHDHSNAIWTQGQPHIDALRAKYPFSHLNACGEAVGLPEGQMGNSEVGHMNLGAGRVVYQDLVKINRAIRDNSIMQNPEIIAAYKAAQAAGKKLHIMGLCSNGGVHSSLDHLFKLVEIAKEYGVADKTFIHCFMDGRDTDPRSGKGFIEELQGVCDTTGAHIASIIGRFYAMDRDKRWERIKVAYDQLVNGVGRQETDMVAAVQGCYDRHTEEHKDTDEFMEPLVNANCDGRISEGDVVIFFNYRNDRAKEITIVLTQQDMPEQGMKTIPGLQYFCMTPYDSSFQGLHVLFPKENVENTLGEVVSKLGMKQLRIAETEKFAHVTFFFNGGREAEYPGEERILIPSPKVPTYDLKPEMSAPEVTEALVAAIKTQKFDYITLNFANGDMIGHTGVYDAIVKAVKCIDECSNKVIEAALANGYEIIIIADHGNCDNAINPDGTPNTAHSLNPVPFVYVSKDHINAKVENGILADVAPSLCHIMGIEQPKEMTGRCLIKD